VSGGRTMTDESRQNSRNGILSLTIKDKAVLYSAYMPFLNNGGLFVPTNKAYDIGDEVFMLLTLMDEPEKIPIAGKVVWVTPRGAQGNRTAGIGVQFSEQDAEANAKIENHLAGSLTSDRPTHTM
jgi:type IV pilus assembly protein PilZ